MNNTPLQSPFYLFEDKELFELYATHHGKEVIYYDDVPVGLLTPGRGGKAEFGWFGTWNRVFAKPEFADFVRSFLSQVDRVFFSDYYNIISDRKQFVFDEDEMVHTYISLKGKSIEDCLKSFESEKRRGVRKLLKSELDISYSMENGGVDVFLKVHQDHLASKQYQPPFTEGFFEAMLDQKYEKFKNELHFCYEGETPLAALLTMRDDNWFYLLTSGMNSRAYELKMGDFLYYNALEYSIRIGCSFFSVGITPVTNTHLLSYKKRFGTECYPYSNFIFYKNNLAKSLFHQGKKIKGLLRGTSS